MNNEESYLKKDLAKFIDSPSFDLLKDYLKKSAELGRPLTETELRPFKEDPRYNYEFENYKNMADVAFSIYERADEERRRLLCKKEGLADQLQMLKYNLEDILELCKKKETNPEFNEEAIIRAINLLRSI